MDCVLIYDKKYFFRTLHYIFGGKTFSQSKAHSNTYSKYYYNILHNFPKFQLDDDFYILKFWNQTESFCTVNVSIHPFSKPLHTHIYSFYGFFIFSLIFILQL